MKKLINFTAIALVACAYLSCKKESVKESPEDAAAKTPLKEINACSSPPQIYGIRTTGGSGDDRGTHIFLHPSGIVALAGRFSNTVDFDPGPGVRNLSGGNFFSQWFDRNARFVDARIQTYEDLSFPRDKQGNVYEIVMEDGIEDPDAVDNCSTSTTQSYALVKKGLGGVVWKRYIAMNTTAFCYITYAVKIDGHENIVVNWGGGWFKYSPAGESLPIDLPGTYNIDQFWLDKQGNIYTGNKERYPNSALTKYNPKSATPLWQIDMPVNAVDFDDLGNVYITGTFEGTRDFNPGTGTYNLTAATTTMFIQKLDAHGKFHWAKKLGPGTPNDIKWDTNGKYIYVAGYFTGTPTYATVTGNVTAASKGGRDAFIMALKQCN